MRNDLSACDFIFSFGGWLAAFVDFFNKASLWFGMGGWMSGKAHIQQTPPRQPTSPKGCYSTAGFLPQREGRNRVLGVLIPHTKDDDTVI